MLASATDRMSVCVEVEGDDPRKLLSKRCGHCDVVLASLSNACQACASVAEVAAQNSTFDMLTEV